MVFIVIWIHIPCMLYFHRQSIMFRLKIMSPSYSFNPVILTHKSHFQQQVLSFISFKDTKTKSNEDAVHSLKCTSTPREKLHVFREGTWEIPQGPRARQEEIQWSNNLMSSQLQVKHMLKPVLCSTEVAVLKVFHRLVDFIYWSKNL